MSNGTFSLDVVRLASPCNVPWDAMSGDARFRFCPQCRLNVFNLSEMTRKEAEALVLQAEGRLCIRFYRRTDGTILTSDCPVGVRAVRRKRALLAAMATAVLLTLGGWSLALVVGMQKKEEVYARLRSMEPFHTVLEWLDPTPPGWGSGWMAPLHRPDKL
jgi:hypothetical protein